MVCVPDVRMGESIEQLVGRARYAISVLLADDVAFADAMSAVLGVAEPRESRSAGRAGAVVPGRPAIRVLCTPSALCAPLVRSRIAGWLRIRIAEGELREALVVDGEVALVRSRTEEAEGNASIVHDPAAVRALDLLFAAAWANARPLADHLGLSSRLRSDLTRRILEKLCAGRTDDVAAGELRISLRTYRRHVAEIMRELGANSRFQAGVRAVELGLLPDQY
ncbi:hypothetical protein GCM10020367_43830 [Streptomyces sannanensis]|uniref:HTH luxR-type domain-containing protein n=1 Tax=Streptomyces sannanensis TaxID=285536 RepID=A0ABP6SG40_9ACTN